MKVEKKCEVTTNSYVVTKPKLITTRNQRTRYNNDWLLDIRKTELIDIFSDADAISIRPNLISSKLRLFSMSDKSRVKKYIVLCDNKVYDDRNNLLQDFTGTSVGIDNFCAWEMLVGTGDQRVRLNRVAFDVIKTHYTYNDKYETDIKVKWADIFVDDDYLDDCGITIERAQNE